MIDLDAYFARIGYDGPRTADLATFRALHALHPARIPFEAIDVLMDRGVDLAPEAIDAKLITARRGGYCFEQNNLFGRVLTALGFEVTGLAGRMRWNQPEGAPLRARTHMVLRVEAEGRSWLADVGFGGCAPSEPLLLETGIEQPTRHDTYRLLPIREGVALETRRDGVWLRAWDMSLDPCVAADYEMANWYSATWPASHFRHNLYAAIATDEARFNLLYNRLSIRPAFGGKVERRRLDADELQAVLADTLGLPVQPDWRPMIEDAVAKGDALGI